MTGSLIIIALLLLLQTTSARWNLFLEKFEACPGTLNTNILYKEANISYRDNGDLYMDQNIVVRQDVHDPIEVVWNIDKCASKEKLDTCMPFYKFKSSRYCRFLQAKGEVWSSFINCITPAWQCPILKGEYKARNCTFDLSLFRLFPLPGSYWRCKITLNSINKQKTLRACVTMEGGVRK